MRHIDVQNSLTDYLEGELDLEIRAKVDEHLEACDACSEELQDLRHAVFLLRRLPNPEPPRTLVSDVMRRIEDGEAAPGFASYMRRAWAAFLVALEPPRVTAPALGLAAGLAIVLAMGDSGFSFKGLGSDTRPVNSVVSTAPSTPLVSPRPPAVNQWNARRQALAARSGERLDLRGSTAPPTRMRNVTGRSGLSMVSAGSSATALPEAREGRLRDADEWIEVVITRPGEFAREHAGLTDLEQELWVTHLGSRAGETGQFDAVVAALQANRGRAAVSLADAFLQSR